MRPDLTSADRTLLDSGSYDLHWEIEVANGSGTMIDLTGRLKGVSFRLPDPNAAIAPGTFTFVRELERDPNASLAPLVAASTMNRLDDGTTYSVLLQVGRAVIVRCAMTARGAARPATGYYEVYRGRIAGVNWPKYDGEVSIRCTDQSGALQKSKSETAYIYANGTAIETATQEVLDNNGWGTYVLSNPTPTGAVLSADYGPGKQKPVWQQVWGLAQSIGNVVWWRYDATGTGKLTLFEPDRNKSVSDFTLAGVRDINALSYNEDEIGNVAYGEYSDADGARRTAGPVEDAASIAEYGDIRRTYWISEPADSPIRSHADMTALLTAAISDTANPDALVEAVTPANPFLEVSVDLVTVPANGRLFDSDQLMAPFSVAVEHHAGKDHESRINLRGKPSAGGKTWRTRRVEAADDPRVFLLQNFRARDSADGLSEVISWTNGAKLEDIWLATRLVQGYVTDADWTALAESVESQGLITSYTVAKPDETDGRAVRLVQVEGTYTDPATGEVITTDAWRRVIYPRVAMAAIDPDTGELADGAVTSAALVQSSKSYGSTLTFSASDNNTVAWTSGSVIVNNGTTYSISAGSTGDMAAATYIYLDSAVSSTVLQTSTSLADAIGDNRLFICFAAPTADTDQRAFFVPGVGVLGLNGDHLSPNSVSTDKLQANSVTAAEIAAIALEVGKYIRSASYSAGVSGWNIHADGSAEFQDVEVRGTLLTGTKADDGAGVKLLPKGAKSGTVYNGQAIAFSDTYNSPPLVIFAGGATDQGGNVWGSKAAVEGGTATGSRPSGLIAQQVGADVSTTGFTANLWLVGKGTLTAESASFASPTSVTSVGSTTGSATPADVDTPSADDRFSVDFRVTATSLSGSGSVDVEVAMDVRKDGGAWTEVGTTWATVTVPSSGTYNEDTSITCTVTAIDGGNDNFRLRVKTVQESGSATWSSISNVTTLTWFTDSGATYASMTPNGAADAIPFFLFSEG